MIDIKDFINNNTDTILSPKTTDGISGFVFSVNNSENLQLNADITDHFTENNSFINDHIVRKPIIIQLSGLVGELVYTMPSGILGSIQDILNRLQVINAYGGDYTPGAQQAISNAITQEQINISEANQVIDKTQNIIDVVSSNFGILDSKQAKAYQDLKALYYTNMLVTVQTPWNFFENMAIQSVGFTQNDDSNSYSDISVTLKEMRFADIKTTTFDENLFPPRNTMQESETVDQGEIKGTRNSFLFDASTALGGG